MAQPWSSFSQIQGSWISPSLQNRVLQAAPCLNKFFKYMPVFKTWDIGVSFVARRLMNSTRIHEDVGSISGLAKWLRIWPCCELWGGLQTRLRSRVAVAVVEAGGGSSDWTPSMGTSTCCGCGPKKTTTTTTKPLGYCT